jgi:hypothetical protein
VTLLARRFDYAALLFSGPSYEGLPFNLSTIFGSCSSLKRGEVFPFVVPAALAYEASSYAVLVESSAWGNSP